MKIVRGAGILLAFSLAVGGRGFAAAGEALPAPGSLSSVVDTGFVTAASIQAEGLFKHYVLPPLPYEVETYLVTFSSRDFDGSVAPVTALLFVPRLAEKADLPVLVFGAGTTGIGDACAPTRELSEGRLFGEYQQNLLAYAAMGLIAILPDYIGFEDPSRPQRYFSKQAEGHAMLDAARAVYNFFELAHTVARPLRKVFIAGYSQGGHAAFSAADLWRTYAPEIPVAGIIGFGATTDVRALLREGPAYAPLIFYTYEQMYGKAEIDPGEYLPDHFARTLEADVTEKCIDQFQTCYSYDSARVYRPVFRQALFHGDLEHNYPSLYRRLSENRAGLDGHGVPALVIQGATDFMVTSETQKVFVTALRAAGSRVTYADLPDVAHKDVRQAGFRLSVDWIEIITRGAPPPEG
jgi:pimeloyl-ACP methyl ester carboxylesterase